MQDQEVWSFQALCVHLDQRNHVGCVCKNLPLPGCTVARRLDWTQNRWQRPVCGIFKLVVLQGTLSRQDPAALSYIPVHGYNYRGGILISHLHHRPLHAPLCLHQATCNGLRVVVQQCDQARHRVGTSCNQYALACTPEQAHLILTTMSWFAARELPRCQPYLHHLCQHVLLFLPSVGTCTQSDRRACVLLSSGSDIDK
jgi:hypothetical protein